MYIMYVFVDVLLYISYPSHNKIPKYATVNINYKLQKARVQNIFWGPKWPLLLLLFLKYNKEVTLLVTYYFLLTIPTSNKSISMLHNMYSIFYTNVKLKWLKKSKK